MIGVPDHLEIIHYSCMQDSAGLCEFSMHPQGDGEDMNHVKRTNIKKQTYTCTFITPRYAASLIHTLML
jgi:hypothetical protein